MLIFHMFTAVYLPGNSLVHNAISGRGHLDSHITKLVRENII
jgi:hypothetical protein